MKKIRQTLRLDQLQLNEGQLDWLGRNPREGSQDDIDKCVKSLLEDPDWLEDKPLSVVPAKEPSQFVVFIGNLRTISAPLAGLTELPCIIYIPEKKPDPDKDGKLTFRVDRDTIIRRALKDNGTFGHWNYDELPNWGIPADVLNSWGVPAWDFDTRKENTDKPTGEINMGGINFSYDVQVTCESIEDQLALIKELDGRGYKCKSL